MKWLKISVIVGVLSVWVFYIVAEVVRSKSIPPIVWSVPGATAALLSDKISAIRFGKAEVKMRKEDEET